MKQFFIVLSCVIITGCAQSEKPPSAQSILQVEEKVLLRSSKGTKEVLICTPQLFDGRGVVVRLRCEDKEVLSLQSHQIYSDRKSAKESIRIYWRDDGNAVVVDPLVTGGSEETSPYYIVWDGCSAQEVSYEPIWRNNIGGETNIAFHGWESSGNPILKVE